MSPQLCADSKSISETQHWTHFPIKETQGRAASAAGRDRSGQLALAVGLDGRVPLARLGSDRQLLCSLKAQPAKACPAAGRGEAALCAAFSLISMVKLILAISGVAGS